MCNPFDMFITATLDPKKYDRYNLKSSERILPNLYETKKRLTGRDLIYVLIPEPHKMVPGIFMGWLVVGIGKN